MIEPTELRIGNYIKDRGDKVWQINHWKSPTKVASKSPIINTGETFGEIEGHPLTEEVNFLKPIQLTEQWIESFGYENIQELACDFDEENVLNIQLYHEEGIIFLQSMKVHELQNFWYINTKKELSIKTE